ncbi:MAG: hypothetical protein ACYC9S_09780 [Leptospirales bacterium]
MDDDSLGHPFLLESGSGFEPEFLPLVNVTREQEWGLGLPSHVGDYHGIPNPRRCSDDEYDADGLLSLEKSRISDTKLREARYPAQVAFIFDLRRGWESQQKDVEKIFKRIQNHLKKIHALESKKNFQTDKFSRYLRILDAKICGARHADINNILLKGDQKRCRGTDEPDLNFHDLVRDTLKAAESIRDRDFRLLFSS